jgi:hypothetical protein
MRKLNEKIMEELFRAGGDGGGGGGDLSSLWAQLFQHEYTGDKTTLTLTGVTNLRVDSFNRCKGVSVLNLPDIQQLQTNALEYNYLDEINLNDGPIACMSQGVFQSSYNLRKLRIKGACATYGTPPEYISTPYNFCNQCPNLEIFDFEFLSSPSVVAKSYKLAGNIFVGDKKLKALILRNSNLVIKADSANNIPPMVKSGTGYVYVPSVLLDAYKADDSWSTYAAQFRVLEEYTVDGTTTGDIDETKI